MTDVLVVGASVAGASVAIQLARLGHSVQLIDRAHFPRRKACGEGLFSPGVAELRSLGVLPALEQQARVLKTLRFEIAGRSIESPLSSTSNPVVGVERRFLDDVLLKAAIDAGVDVRLGLRATDLAEEGGRYAGVKTQEGWPLTARIIVAADGASSGLRQRAGLNVSTGRRRYGVSAHFELPETPEPRIEVRFRADHEVYLTPVGGRLVNVAVLMGRERAASLSGRLRKTYCEMVRQAGAVPEGAVLADEPLAVGPFPVVAKKAWRANLVLAGDAAGFYDGVTGEGMSLALVTARLCAEAVHATLEDGSESHFARYDCRRRSLARNSQLLGRFVLTLAAHPRLAAVAVANLSRRPATFTKLVEINQGERPLSSLRPRDFSALLLGL